MVTDDQIRALRAEAATAGDLEMIGCRSQVEVEAHANASVDAAIARHSNWKSLCWGE